MTAPVTGSPLAAALANAATSPTRDVRSTWMAKTCKENVRTINTAGSAMASSAVTLPLSLRSAKS